MGYLVFVLNAPEWIHGTVTFGLFPYTLSPSFPRSVQSVQDLVNVPRNHLARRRCNVCYLTRRYVLPGLVVLLPFLVALWGDAQSDVSGSALLAASDLYRLHWFVILGAALLALGLEWGVRRLRIA